MLDISSCLGRTQYGAKDAAKAARATKYIGRGSARSSTNAYRIAIGPALANTASYTARDVVWISAEGNRQGRIDPDRTEIMRACASGATIITDTSDHRNRPYNLGERQVTAILIAAGYREAAPGLWKPHPLPPLN